MLTRRPRLSSSAMADKSNGTIVVRLRDGEVRSLSGKFGFSVMEILKARGLVEAVCGGMCSCGTCLVRIAPDWAARIATMDEAEAALVGCLVETSSVGLRLGCQIPFGPELDGLSIDIVEEDY